MSDNVAAGALLATAALVLAGLISMTLHSGEIVGRYGTTVTRATAPRRFWAGVVVFACLDAVLVAFAALAFLYRGAA